MLKARSAIIGLSAAGFLAAMVAPAAAQVGDFFCSTLSIGCTPPPPPPPPPPPAAEEVAPAPVKKKVRHKAKPKKKAEPKADAPAAQ